MISSPAARAFASARIAERDAGLLADLRPPAWVFLAGVKVPLSSSDLRRAAGKA